MTKVTVTPTTYQFHKPEQLSEHEFNSLKQTLNQEPNYHFLPPSGFWVEFEYVKWCVIIILFGGYLAYLYKPLFFIPALAGLFLIFGMITGTAESMWSYQIFLNNRRHYYLQLKKAILTANNYTEFKQLAADL